MFQMGAVPGGSSEGHVLKQVLALHNAIFDRVKMAADTAREPLGRSPCKEYQSNQKKPLVH